MPSIILILSILLIELAISQLKTIASKMPTDENPHDLTSVKQTASFLWVLSDIMNKQNFAFLNYSHHYRQGLDLIEKYKRYL